MWAAGREGIKVHREPQGYCDNKVHRKPQGYCRCAASRGLLDSQLHCMSNRDCALVSQVRKAAVETFGILSPSRLAEHGAALAALLNAVLGVGAAYVRAAAAQVLSQIDTSVLPDEQASALQKHLMGHCYRKKLYEARVVNNDGRGSGC